LQSLCIVGSQLAQKDIPKGNKGGLKLDKKRPQSGVIVFKSQREINEERQQKIQEDYKKLQEEVQKILKKNYETAKSITTDDEYKGVLSEEEMQRVFKLREEINRIFENAKKRSDSK
jgi:mRNA-degrading endonuclease RelE of RelBE toxin-antitoxin system